MGLPDARIVIEGTKRAWPGDQPKVHITVDRMRELGWTAKLTSDQAVRIAVRRMPWVRIRSFMNVCVIGLWHQGIVAAACLADLGCTVVAADHDSSKIALLGGGKAPLV